MKITEVIQRIQSLYSKGVQSDDSRLSSRHIYNKMLTVRSKLIVQQTNKKQKISQWNYQTLSCVELIQAPVHECPCLPNIGCEILKTKYKLPQPLTNMNKHLIQSVSSLDGSILFSEVSWNEKKYKSSNKYTANKPDYYFLNDYLYVTQKKGPKVISITGLFENPLDVEDYPNMCDKPCTNTLADAKSIEVCPECISPLDKEFPIDLSLIDTLVQLSAQELVSQFNSSIEDRTNNTHDNLTQYSK